MMPYLPKDPAGLRTQKWAKIETTDPGPVRLARIYPTCPSARIVTFGSEEPMQTIPSMFRKLRTGETPVSVYVDERFAMSHSTAEQLRHEIRNLPEAVKVRLKHGHFDPERLLRLARPLLEAAAIGADAAHEKVRRETHNRMTGPVSAPGPSEIPPLAEDEELRRALQTEGLRALQAGQVALCVMAGGMATRMGGIVKALVPVFEERSFLDLRLQENACWRDRLGVPMPLWLMTSDATDEAVNEALRQRQAPPWVRTFTQDISLRLTPDGHLFRDAGGDPSTYATGHGDVVEGLRRSGLLDEFRKQGGRYVWITNLDNLGATVDPVLLGQFIRMSESVLVEVVEKATGDRGGIPVHAQGRLQVLEEFRLPEGFDASQVRVFNTNTFLVRADALATADVAWNWFEVEKKVGDQTVVQFERLLQELTACLPAAYVRVPREGNLSRFLPVKDNDELERRRSTIEAVARARGMV